MNRLFLIALIFFYFHSSAQVDVIFDEAFGDIENEEANNVKLLNDKNLLIVGYTESEGNGKKDGYVIKMNQKGEIIWNVTFGGPDNDELFDAVELNDGNLAFCGYTESKGAGKKDFWVVISRNDGSFVWDNTYGGDSDEEGLRIFQSPDSMLVIGGYTKSFGGGNRDFYAIKINQNLPDKTKGKIVWKKNMGGNGADYPSNIVYNASDTTYNFVGTTNSYGEGSGDIWFVKLKDDRGQIKQKKTFGKKLNEFGGDIVILENNDMMILGSTSSESAGLNDAWIMKVNWELDEYFIKSFGKAKEDKMFSMVQSGKNVIACGSTNSEGEGAYDMWLAKIDLNGNLVWETTLGDVKNDIPVKIIKNEANEYFAVGSTNSKGGGKLDIWVVKFK